MTCAFVLQASEIRGIQGRFLRLFTKQGRVAGNDVLRSRFHENPRFSISNQAFQKLPGSPLAYWLTDDGL